MGLRATPSAHTLSSARSGDAGMYLGEVVRLVAADLAAAGAFSVRRRRPAPLLRRCCCGCSCCCCRCCCYCCCCGGCCCCRCCCCCCCCRRRRRCSCRSCHCSCCCCCCCCCSFVFVITCRYPQHIILVTAKSSSTSPWSHPRPICSVPPAQASRSAGCGPMPHRRLFLGGDRSKRAQAPRPKTRMRLG